MIESGQRMIPLYESVEGSLKSDEVSKEPSIEQKIQEAMRAAVTIAPQAPAAVKTIQNDIRTYVEKQERASHVAYSQAYWLIEEGKNFFDEMRSGAMLVRNGQEMRKMIVPFTWYLFSKAIEKGQGFQQGTFVIPDPGHRLWAYFMSVATPRTSSHYAMRTVGGQFGIDQPGGGLPNGFHTVLFGKLRTPPGTGDWLFWKPENFGRESAQEEFCHCSDFLFTRVQRVFGQIQGPLDRKEHPLSHYDQRLKTLVQYSIETKEFPIHGWGISGAIYAISLLMGQPEQVQALTLPARRSLIDFLRDILARYDNLQVRQGNEVFPIEMEDPFKARLQAFLFSL